MADLSLKDFKDFFPVVRMAGQHGKGVNKALDVSIDPVNKRIWYSVKDQKVNIYDGPDLEVAIALYNKI